MSSRIAVCGGVYSNHLALEAVCRDARARGADEIYCLGDLGGFGPHPDRIWPILTRHRVLTIQGNYEESLSQGLPDCNCGYTDPRDNHFARISYEYTAERTGKDFKLWMGGLPREFRIDFGRRRLLMVHGSPRRINEFLWYSTSPVPFLGRLLDEFSADILLVTHTGLPWQRILPANRQVINVGAVGRPPNHGRTEIGYVMLEAGAELGVRFIPVSYDHETLVAEMKEEGLPVEFRETLSSGWWTTCLEILPAKERAAGRY